MLPDDKEIHIAEVHNLIVPMIIGETQRNYSEFIAYLLWRIPTIMVDVVREYNEGARMPKNGEPDLPPEPDPPIVVEPKFTEAKVTAWVLTIRQGPDKSFKIVQYKLRNDIVRVYEAKAGWSRIDPILDRWVSSTYLTPL